MKAKNLALILVAIAIIGVGVWWLAQPKAVIKNDAQAELNATFDDAAAMLQKGDLVGLFEKYTPPDVFAKLTPDSKEAMKQIALREKADPAWPEILQRQLKVLQVLRSQTPVINATGDTATYTITQYALYPDVGNAPVTSHVIFEKIGGRWYKTKDIH